MWLMPNLDGLDWIVFVQGLVTLVTMAPPVALSLLLLVRREASAGMRWEVLQRARASVLQQCGLLDEGRPLTIPVSALAVRASPAPLDEPGHGTRVLTRPGVQAGTMQPATPGLHHQRRPVHSQPSAYRWHLQTFQHAPTRPLLAAQDTPFEVVT